MYIRHENLLQLHIPKKTTPKKQVYFIGIVYSIK